MLNRAVEQDDEQSILTAR